ncbi:MAG: HAD family phosphatase [Verrucomicrobia bacterium]|nr:HAD family phosphatase [Verrucomicrobiota bacterium]
MIERTIFFDLGNVLLFFDHGKMYKQVADYTGLPLAQVQEFLFQFLDPYERGLVSSHEIQKLLSDQTGKELDLDRFKWAASDIFVPNTETIAIAERLKEKGHRLFLLSNTCDAHFAHAKKQFDFFTLFDGFVLSYEVGLRKPEKQIYEKALEIAGCQKESCFYTDDIVPYIEAARAFGIDAEPYTTPVLLSEQLFARGML